MPPISRRQFVQKAAAGSAAARFLQAYELLFWDTLADGL